MGLTDIELGVLDGDGIGPEVVSAAAQVAEAALEARGIAVRWRRLPIGHAAIAECGDPLPESTLEALAGLDGWLLGPHDNVSYPTQFAGRVAPGGLIRKRFDLFANIRPARSLGPATDRALDLVIVRENTEGFYADRNMFAGSGEFMPTPDVAMAVGVFTRPAIERIAHEAFRTARDRGGRVTIAHKANVLAMTTGLFKRVCEEVGAQYPDVPVDGEHIDALAALLVRRGHTFDVIVAENMFGDILSDLAGELAGSIGAAPSLNASGTQAMAQAVHGAAPDIAGQGLANPTAMILSTALLLRWLGERRGPPALTRAADDIDSAVHATLQNGTRTRDLGGEASTEKFTRAVVATLR
ncbi:isocitrate/isopropylmalate dehydrogenase family protein [Tomitella biformata]|uniref:isocitrate/isopropylmalate dehydrogenase family protein n=1 Tax=Tomitella biformata TaxID=630403 RepID=UPI0004642655|nr:isocitrate/isopropylmalate family dehydrogenase [Tomitella biformata]